MGGQACVFYGAAEFSRDIDLLVLTDPTSIELLKSALHDLQATPIAVPAFEPSYLNRGHAVHFRCTREDVSGLRIDLMSVLRGVDEFEKLWLRRTTLEIDDETLDLLSLPDLVLAKKTQRDKDWPMIRRLVEQSYLLERETSDAGLMAFWLQELRTPELLIRVCMEHPERAARSTRPATVAAFLGDPERVTEALEAEERDERRKDRQHWDPLKRELERLRHANRSISPQGKKPGPPACI
jgi:hypothetical protein